MIILILILGFLLVITSSFSRPEPIIIVHERRNSNPLWLVLLIGGGLWLYTSLYASADFFSTTPLTAPEEHEDSVDHIQINQAPASHRLVTSADTLINATPPSHGGASFTAYQDTDERHLQHIILVKRFADEGKAELLQRHFSQWGMQVLRMYDSEYPYWNCVFIANESEGHNKIREWNQHHSDFAHMELELLLTEIETQ